jgi:hypothetical protein
MRRRRCRRSLLRAKLSSYGIKEFTNTHKVRVDAARY